jgi:carboxyl-terminal processing protease
LKKLLSLLLIFSSVLCWGSKLPEIDAEDVSSILHQIMEAHATYKELSPQLAKRALSNYIEELDPLKTYFLESETKKWLQAEASTIEKFIQSVDKGEFKLFEEIHSSMVKAIQRREKIEQRIAKAPLPKAGKIKDFKELSWAKNEKELEERLLQIRALQTEACEKLEPDAREKVFLRLAKRRKAKEEEMATGDPVMKERVILSAALKAFASSFDSHTTYFTPLEAAQFMISVQQRLFGIGAQLRDDLNGFTIVKILEGSPASRSTLKEKDRVIAIDGEPVVGMEITDCVELIRGQEGTKVNLTVLRENEKKIEETCLVEVTRGEVVIKEARLETELLPYGDGVIARLALHAFYQDPVCSSAGDLFEEITRIRKDHKIRGVLLDLRDNAGGILPQAVSVTGLFITKGIVCGVKDNTGKVEYLREIDGRTVYDGPLVVLTSKGSASAAEIVAQTLQDYGRAIVVGDEHTYGKGTFQTFTLDATNNGGTVNPKGEFKVTRGRYYTVSGKSPQLVGVIPDVIVPGPYSGLEIGEQHAENPLENDSIPENFKDDLSDIPAFKREHVSWLYRFNLQPRLKTYTRFIPILKENSERRIKEDKLFQNFLAEMKKEGEELKPEICQLYSEADLQLREATNVLKDLIFLMN